MKLCCICNASFAYIHCLDCNLYCCCCFPNVENSNQTQETKPIVARCIESPQMHIKNMKLYPMDTIHIEFVPKRFIPSLVCRSLFHKQ